MIASFTLAPAATVTLGPMYTLGPSCIMETDKKILWWDSEMNDGPLTVHVGSMLAVGCILTCPMMCGESESPPLVARSSG